MYDILGAELDELDDELGESLYEPSIGSFGLADDDLGQRRFFGGRRMRRRRMPAGRLRRARLARAANALVSPMPGAPRKEVVEYPLGFGVASFTESSGTALTLTARPQRPFQGRRLSINVARTGTTATGLLTITQLLVGQNNQIVSAQALGAETFAPTAFGVGLKLDPSQPGIDITITLAVSVAPTMTDRIDVSVDLIGPSIG